MQLGNAPRVNSIRSTFLIFCFEASESKTNLEVALGHYSTFVVFRKKSHGSSRDKCRSFRVRGLRVFVQTLRHFGVCGKSKVANKRYKSCCLINACYHVFSAFVQSTKHKIPWKKEADAKLGP